MIVMKFGGTSVGSSSAIARLETIVRDRLNRQPIVVVSAMAGATNLLLDCARQASLGNTNPINDNFEKLRWQHFVAANELFGDRPDSYLKEITEQFEKLFSHLRALLEAIAVLQDLTPRSADAVASYGERLSSILVANYLEKSGIAAQLLDAREFIITDERFTSAVPLTDHIEARARKIVIPPVLAGKVPVTQGFIGASLTGVTTTIGRGGSDYSAALIGAAINVDAIEIWTDVDGLLTGDPRILANVKKLKVIGFNEAAELAYFGAKVLHPATVVPAIKENIPVYILNSMNPSNVGTCITAEAPPSRNPIKAIACRRGITVINVSSTRMLMAYGFLRKIFEIFDKFETAVDVVSTSEVSVSLTLDNTEKINAVVDELTTIGEVTIEKERAIICVVGAEIKSTPGIAGRLFKCMEQINIDMISQGASHINITLVVAEADLTKAVAALHDEFFSDLDPEVFE